MNKIIKGKRYNTETAAEICEHQNGVASGFERLEETLYQKRSGEFFLHYAGGALTKYAVRCGNETSGSEGIKPLTENEAKQFCEKYADAETYAQMFGDPDPDDNLGCGETVNCNLRLSAQNYEKLKKTAVDKRITMSELANRIIAEM